MHVIRLREPWMASIELADTESTEETPTGTLVYSRKFHKPTATDDQAILLRVGLLPATKSLAIANLKVLVNDSEVSAQLPAEPGEGAATESKRFELVDLAPFNRLELRILNYSLDDTLAPANPPRFGTFVIQSVELEIQ
jgi:hypothetical protein